MSKRLKRRVRELCGLDSLSKEDRLLRAKEILENNKIKQKLCNQMPGLTFKDIDRTMEAVLEERYPTDKELEELELRELAPEKFEPPIPAIDRPPKTEGPWRPLTREDVARLMAASKKPVESEPVVTYTDYHTYSPEEVQVLLENYKKKVR